MRWQKLDSKKVFDHPRMVIYEDRVLLPNGIETSYVYIGDLRDAAMVIPIRSDGKILLQGEYNYPPDEILLQFPGGMLKHGDTPEMGAKRELAEEAQLGGDLKKIGWFYPDNRKKKHKMHVFVATNLAESVAEGDQEELFEDHWFSEKEIDSLVKDNGLTNHTALAAWVIYKNS